MSAPIVSVLLVIVAFGALALAAISVRLRAEIAQLLRAFELTERNLVPLTAAIRRDRFELSVRLDTLVEPGSRFDSTRR